MSESRYSFSSLVNALDALVTPPCRGAPIAVWLFFILLSLSNKGAQIWHGNLSDPDDYLYLVQAQDWLNGQGWFDPIQHRMNPPQGTFIHFSHLLSGFYAGFIFLFHHFFDSISAALITSALLPPLYLALLLLCVRRLAQIMIDPAWGDMTAYVILFSAPVTSQFVLGHIDHHGLEALLAVAAFCCMARMVENPAAWIWAVVAGFILALGLVIGLEIIAIVGLLSLCLGVWAAIEGGSAARSALVFALALFVASAGLLAATRAPVSFFDTDTQAYSIVYVILTGAFALCFACVALLAGKSFAILRPVIGGMLACITGFVFLYSFPFLRQGPYGGMDPVLAHFIFAAAPEAWPVIRPDRPWLEETLPLVWPVMAVFSALFMIVHAQDRTRRWLWGMMFLVVSVCIGLAAFYQCRFLSYENAFAAIPVAAMIKYDWTQKQKSAQAIRMLRLFLLLFVGPATALAAGDSDKDVAIAANIAATKDQKPVMGCDMHFLANLLNKEQGYGSRPRLIINSLNEGSELLFRTRHDILAAPYHMNVDGNLDAMKFFATSDPEEAKAIAAKRKADLVVICTIPSQLWGYNDAAQRSGQDAQQSFAQQLAHHRIPAWLKEIPLSHSGDLMLFEIVLSP